MHWLSGGQVFRWRIRPFPATPRSLLKGTRIAAVTDSPRPLSEDEVIDVAGLCLLPRLDRLPRPFGHGGRMSPIHQWWRAGPDSLIAIYAAKAAERTLLGGTTDRPRLWRLELHRNGGAQGHQARLVHRPRYVPGGSVVVNHDTAASTTTPVWNEVANGADEVARRGPPPACARRRLHQGTWRPGRCFRRRTKTPAPSSSRSRN
jgi:hypothetical protein